MSHYRGAETDTVLFDAPVPVKATGGADGTGLPRFHLETARPLGTIRGTFRYRNGGNYRCDMRSHIASELEDGRVD